MARPHLSQTDPEIEALIQSEEQKQQNKLSMIASENFASASAREALGSVFVNKYAEGYPGKRYYEGNQFVDQVEQLAIDRARAVFQLPADWGVNVQPLSGSNANLAVYNALLQPGDTIMGMYLPDGGHLSHGWSYAEKDEAIPEAQKQNPLLYLGGSRKVNITSRVYNVVQYRVTPETNTFDYEQVRQIALEYKPKIIISGGTAYPRLIDYAALAAIAAEVGAYYMADIAHEAGLIAGGANPSPIGIADVVTFTTQKTLRGPRGAMILARGELIDAINRAIFPGMQGGPSEHTIASIAVTLGEALRPEFKTYAAQVVKNAQTLAAELMTRGYHVVSGGTDKHLVLIDLRSKGLTGRIPAKCLDAAGIICNYNTVPHETGSPFNPSGLRIGTPFITTRGMQEAEVRQIAEWIDRAIQIAAPYADMKPSEFVPNTLPTLTELAVIAEEVKALCARFPLAI